MKMIVIVALLAGVAISACTRTGKITTVTPAAPTVMEKTVEVPVPVPVPVPVVVPGPAGPAGEAGATDPTGEKGAMGATGKQGDTDVVIPDANAPAPAPTR